MVGSGAVLPDSHDAGMEDIESAKAEGNLDTGMAELTLGQRLKAVAGEELHDFSSDSSQSDVGKRRRKKNQTEGAIEVPNESLSRTLIQALHSGDTKLLEACLRHSDLGLIRNTVKRLPQQLTVPLLTACVERLGRGRGGNTGRGRGAAASAQRGSTIVAWVRTVLIVHSGYLMTVRLFAADVYYRSFDAASKPCCKTVFSACHLDEPTSLAGAPALAKWSVGSRSCTSRVAVVQSPRSAPST